MGSPRASDGSGCRLRFAGPGLLGGGDRSCLGPCGSLERVYSDFSVR